MKYVTCENTNLDLAFLHSDTIVYLPVSIVTTSLKRITAGTVALAWKRGWLKSSPRTCSWCHYVDAITCKVSDTSIGTFKIFKKMVYDGNLQKWGTM